MTGDETGEMNTRPRVVCLHGSASNGGQWRAFCDAVRGRCNVNTPNLVGYGARRYRADRRFRLSDEVAEIVDQIGDSGEPFHLIGHSYGGAVATYFALRYPERVKSLILYEPTNFMMLFAEGLHTDEAREVRSLRAAFGKGGGTALSRWRAARFFIGYWSGIGGWKKMGFKKRARIASLTPKVAAEFDAIAAEADVMSDLSTLNMPVRIICGTRTTLAAKRVCQLLAAAIKDAQLLQLVGLRHMAPLTDPHSVNPLLLDYVLPNPATSLPDDIGRRAS